MPCREAVARFPVECGGWLAHEIARWAGINVEVAVANLNCCCLASRSLEGHVYLAARTVAKTVHVELHSGRREVVQ